MKKFFAWLFAIIIILAAGYGIGAIITNEVNPVAWFKKKDDKDEDKNGTGNTDAAILSDFEGDGMQVRAVLLPVEAYEANGVAEDADTAYKLTYTVTPADATDKGVNVSVAFVNPASAWATGKDVANYVTAEYQGETSILVTCLAPFAEQITLTMTSKSNENATAKCTVDYLRRPVSVDVKAGDYLLNNRSVTLYFGRSDTTQGGTVTYTVKYSDVYTIDCEYTVKVGLFHELEELYGSGGADTRLYASFNDNSGNLTFDYSDSEDIVGKSIYFDRRFFEEFGLRYRNGTQGYTFLKDMTAADINKAIGSRIKGKMLWGISFEATCSEHERTITLTPSFIRISAVNATVPADSVSPDVPGFVF